MGTPEAAALTLDVHVSTAGGTPVKFGTIAVPLSISLVGNGKGANVEVRVELDDLNTRIADELHKLADRMKVQRVGGFTDLFEPRVEVSTVNTRPES